jgi:hypothetical protein
MQVAVLYSALWSQTLRKCVRGFVSNGLVIRVTNQFLLSSSVCRRPNKNVWADNSTVYGLRTCWKMVVKKKKKSSNTVNWWINAFSTTSRRHIFYHRSAGIHCAKSRNVAGYIPDGFFLRFFIKSDFRVSRVCNRNGGKSHTKETSCNLQQKGRKTEEKMDR